MTQILISGITCLEHVKRVFVNGYGSIGSRISAFLKDDPEIRLVGVAKHTPGAGVELALSQGLDVYVPESAVDNFDGYDVSGTLESALDSSDLVIDASPGGQGYRNKVDLYEPRNILAIYQGGETIYGEHSVSDILFNSRTNYSEAFERQHVMQGSCNVTGMGRILSPLVETYGEQLERFDVTLIRRWADIEQTDKKLRDTIEMTPAPHHGEDVKAYLGRNTPLHVRAVKVPSRQMHLHIIDIRFADKAPTSNEVHGIFGGEYGVATLWTAKGTADVRKFADSMEFSFRDTSMIHIHASMTRSSDDMLQMMYSDDQTWMVIPENHLLMQAMLLKRPYKIAYQHTEDLFHMNEKESRLQAHFSLDGA